MSNYSSNESSNDDMDYEEEYCWEDHPQVNKPYKY